MHTFDKVYLKSETGTVTAFMGRIPLHRGEKYVNRQTRSLYVNRVNRFAFSQVSARATVGNAIFVRPLSLSRAVHRAHN